jgi:branched-chain amino acid transport system substrate-binding protein
MKMSNRAFKVMALVATLALLAAACGTGEPEAGGAYKIGFASAITGPGSSLGEPERNTAEMIAEQLTADGGVLGADGKMHPVEVIIYDTESNPDTAVSVVRRLIEEDEVQVIVAGSLSGNSLAIVPVVTEAEVPYISMASARSIIMNPETGDTYAWAFKTPQENLHSAVWQAMYLTDQGLSTVCYLYENTGYGADCYNNGAVALADANIEIVYEDTFERSDTEFGAQMAGVQAAGCDAVVVGAIPPGASTVTVALRDFVPEIPVVHGHGTCNQAFIDLAGGAAEGVVSPCGRLMAVETLPTTTRKSRS